jgi:Tfp pilus assembly protein PilX
VLVIRRLTQRFLREQDGITLVMAIAAMCVLAITTTGVIVAGTANEGTAWVSTKGRSAFAVAQAALAYGEGMVYAEVASGSTPPTTIQDLPTQPNDATGTYVASTSDNVTWHVVGTGTLEGVTRTVSADVTPAQTVTKQQLAIWNYLFEQSNNPNSVSGGAVINMPILTGGDFGVSGGSKILGSLEVGHNLTTSGTGTSIGSASSPVPLLEIANTANNACNILGTATAPGVAPCDGLHAGAYASIVGTTLDTTPQMPTVDFTAAYNAQATLTQTGCPANLFDNNTKMDNGNSANISSSTTGLFGASYDCYIGTNHLKWDSATKTLTANGTFYFDGTLTAPSGVGNVVYNGLASFYFTGGVTWNTGSLCGIAGCGAGWDTKHNVLFVVAQCWANATGTGPGSTLNPCVSISSASAVFQFGVYATKTYKVSGNAGNMAPVICDKFTISGGSDLLIPIQSFPPGTPAPSTSVAYTGTPPTGWSG